MKKLIRIIPSLLIKDGYLVKGTKFENHVYVGDIYNAVKIFSEKKVHEIQILDISARDKSKCIDIELIKKIRKEIFVPLSVGGGFNSLDQVSKIINEGVEKVIINSINFENKNLIKDIANKFGSQSVIVSIDVKKINNNYKIFSNNGKIQRDNNLIEYLKYIQESGAGEIILTSIDREGTKLGLDLDLYKAVEKYINIPLIANGGASNIDNIINFFDKHSFSAVSCGKIFVFYGNRDAVLINYPDEVSIEKIMNKYE